MPGRELGERLRVAIAIIAEALNHKGVPMECSGCHGKANSHI